ncbi:hypothetical protein GCM10009693_10430 [Leucobacter chromiireducens subsp. chromiireducens]
MLLLPRTSFSLVRLRHHLLRFCNLGFEFSVCAPVCALRDEDGAEPCRECNSGRCSQHHQAEGRTRRKEPHRGHEQGRSDGERGESRRGSLRRESGEANCGRGEMRNDADRREVRIRICEAGSLLGRS